MLFKLYQELTLIRYLCLWQMNQYKYKMNGFAIVFVVVSSILFSFAIGLQFSYILNTVIYNLGSSDQRYQTYIYIVSSFSVLFHLIVAIMNCINSCAQRVNKRTRISELIGFVILLFFQFGTTSVFVVVRQYINPYTPLAKKRYNTEIDIQSAYDHMPGLIIAGYIWAILLFVIIVIKSHLYFEPQLHSPPMPQQIIVYQQQEMMPRPIQSERRLPGS